MIQVVVGILRDRRGNVLISQRRPGTHMAGRWEFPGGKIETGESAWAALQRELQEELSVAVHDASPFMTLEHEYQDRRVHLDIWLVTGWDGEPRSSEGQQLRWAAPDQLRSADLLEADAPIVEALLASHAPAARGA